MPGAIFGSSARGAKSAGPYGSYSSPSAPMPTGQVNLDVMQRQQTQANAQRTAGMQTGAIGAVTAAHRAGVGGQASYTDPSTGITYNFGGAYQDPNKGGGAGAYSRLPSMSELEPYLAQRVPRDTMPGRIAPPDKADRAAAEAAAYGRAKDLIGKNQGGALKSLQRSMSARGIRGSGLESAGLSDIVGAAQGQLGQVARDQAIEGLKRDYAVEDRNYAGDINQRAQTMNYMTNQRGQDVNFETNRVSLIPALVRLMQSGGAGVAY